METKRGGGSKLTRTEVVTVRLDPKLRYGVDLAGRKHRRTASSFIEWAIEQALEQVKVRDYKGNEESVRTAHDRCWDVDEPDRLVNMALLYPDILSHEEQRIWKLIVSNPFFASRRPPRGLPTHPLEPDRALVREHWQTLKQVARDELGEHALPKAAGATRGLGIQEQAYPQRGPGVGLPESGSTRRKQIKR